MKISFVIPAYNAESYIFDCISSIVKQRGGEYEIIVINDGSTDSTEQILCSLKPQIPTLRVYNITNGGQSIARNLGVAYATGEYIFFVDADDLISSDSIEKLYSVIDVNPVDIIFFNGTAFYDSSALQDEHLFNYIRNNEYYNKVFDLSSFAVNVINSGGFIAQPCLYIFKRNLFKNNEFYPGIIHEDNLFTAKMMLNNNGLCYVLGESLYKRRVRDDSTMTTRKSQKNIIGYVTCASEISKLEARSSKSVNRVVDRLSVIWFKESLLINNEYQLSMDRYIRAEIKKSNVSLHYKILLLNRFAFTVFVKTVTFLKSLKKVVR